MQPRRQSDRHAPTGADAVVGDPMSGRLLDGRYRIGPRIARGGMASVYEATDLRLDRTVAVKIMHPGMGDDEEFAARFVREARAAARLSHPNVVAVYDQGQDDGTVYLAMELIPGHTLRDVIRKEAPMSPARALALIEPVLSALATAHRAGLVHRDVKPENVLIATDPGSGASRVKVADFGLAKAVSADTQHTATGGVLIGTVSYLAPELVIDGRSDARADVYAAGVVLFELLTGVKPHEGESPIQVAYKHVHEDVPPPSQLVPGIPAYVDALVARATARDRAQRPADAGVLLHQVRRVAHALADGVQDDPELTADLAPALTRPAGDDTVAVQVPRGRHDTAPDPFDGAELAALFAPAAAAAGQDAAERTSLIPRSDQRPPSPPTRAPGGGAPRRPRRSRRGPMLLVLLLLLVAAAGAGAWWFGWARYTSTPGVIGLTKSAAVDKLRAAGLDAEMGDKAYSETVPAGRVIDTDPDAGSRVLDGGTVTVVVSLGKERYDVPRTKGMSEDEGQDAILGAHLSYGRTIERWSETVPDGTVLGTDPKAGTTLRPDTAVSLIVSKGPRPITVRDWTGKDADRAEQALRGKGLEVDRGSGEYSDTVPEGHVISQTPTSGTLHRGDTVTLVVSKGPELVEVPGGLVASGVEAATAKLEALGFKVEVKENDHYIGVGYVYSVDPGSGSMIPKGSTVTLSIL
ncbi:Stk1 family PASTA domain-containing Ser/Thr kinase [Nocardioides sp. MAHUQ-72]|uniref:Stk1 family PASTA domain-containing Ser/Thr kinase n=1 Tax=unclassified Nocardioides TaxID=2615069 RepID=UPI003616CF68